MRISQLAFYCLLLVLSACSKGDIAAGKQRAQLCMMCHQSSDFTGRSEADINAAIKAKMSSGTHPSIGELSHQDRADLSAFLSARD